MKKRINQLHQYVQSSKIEDYQIKSELENIDIELREMVIIPKWWLIFAGIAFGAGLIAMVANLF